MRAVAFLLMSGILFSACKKDHKLCGCVPPPAPYLAATVLFTNDIACGRPVLLFEDTASIRAITGYSGTYPPDRFVANQLPAELNVQHKKLRVLAQKLPSEEEFMCITVGAAYPHVKILLAKEE